MPEHVIGRTVRRLAATPSAEPDLALLDRWVSDRDQSAFELLVSRYPDTPNVHYSYGVFLLAEQPEKAIELFQRELKVSPQNVYAKLQIAFAHIRRGEYDQALPWALSCSAPGGDSL